MGAPKQALHFIFELQAQRRKIEFARDLLVLMYSIIDLLTLVLKKNY
jgi:hypothetical protein